MSAFDDSKLNLGAYSFSMPKRRAKSTVKNPPAKRRRGSDCDDTNAEKPEDEKEKLMFSAREVEHRIAATQAIRDVEIEHLLIVLRLLRSNFNEQQLKTPILQYLKENMPNLSVTISENDGGGFKLEWKDRDGNSSSCHATDKRNMPTSLLQRMHVECLDSGAMPTTDAFDFTSKTVKKNLLGAADLHIPDSAVEESPKNQMLGLQDALRIPEVITQDLSAGLINKIQRAPKAGELVHSVHGSPLGVYKEHIMGVICGNALLLLNC